MSSHPVLRGAKIVGAIAAAMVGLLIASSPVQSSAHTGPRPQTARIGVYEGAADIGGAGDVDGDGGFDLVLGADHSDPLGREGAGAVFVARSASGAVDLRSGGFEGFRIAGAAAGDGLSAACVIGDVNRDGFDDLLMGAEGADTSNGPDSGAAYVVFGSAETADVDIADLEDGRGFTITGANEADGAGADVACPGDVNDDGRPDLVVAAPGGGATYVVFGGDGTQAVDLRLFDLTAHGTSGYRISTPSPDPSGRTQSPRPATRAATGVRTSS